MSRFILFIALCALSVVSFGQTPAQSVTGQDPQTAPASPAGKGKRNKMHALRKAVKKMDTDGDGKIGRAEWQGNPDNFAKLDIDQDGFLTKKEMREVMQDNIKQALQQFDANSDGKITREEWTRNPQAFDRLDTNKDGALTSDEMRQIKGMRRKQPQTSQF